MITLGHNDTLCADEPTLDDVARFAMGELDALVLARRYELRRVLGRGGMATVFAAYDKVLARDVAVKVLDDFEIRGIDLRLGFLSEARIMARLRHPNIVEVLDFRTTSTGVVYLTMELLCGENLQHALERVGRFDWPRARALMLDICAGLGAVHAAGIVHRDLKPSNCLCVRDQDGHARIRLLDFGVATRINQQINDTTRVDEIVGTPEYMAPEQVRGGVIDHRADIYAAGLILGELLTGRLPFGDVKSSALLVAHVYEPIPPLSELVPEGVRLPRALNHVYARATSRDPDNRYPDMRSFAQALLDIEVDAASSCKLLSCASLSSRWARVRRTPRAWLGHALAAGVALVVLGVGAMLSLGEAAPASPDTVDVASEANTNTARPLEQLADDPDVEVRAWPSQAPDEERGERPVIREAPPLIDDRRARRSADEHTMPPRN